MTFDDFFRGLRGELHLELFDSRANLLSGRRSQMPFFRSLLEMNRVGLRDISYDSSCAWRIAWFSQWFGLMHIVKPLWNLSPLPLLTTDDAATEQEQETWFLKFSE